MRSNRGSPPSESAVGEGYPTVGWNCNACRASDCRDLYEHELQWSRSKSVLPTMSVNVKQIWPA